MGDMLFQFLGSTVIGLAGLNLFWAIHKKSPFSAFAAGFVASLGTIIIIRALS